MTVPQLENSEMPLARCSDASLTRTLRRAERIKKKAKGVLAERRLKALSAAPTPTQIRVILGIVLVAFRGVLSLTLSGCPAL